MNFRFTLTQAEKDSLHELVRLSIRSRFEPDVRLPTAVSEKLEQPFGAFVTLKKHGHLRGCIGHVVGDKPLRETIAEMARAAAFNDPRFPPLAVDELAGLDVEISILSPLTPCAPGDVEPGRHGLLIRRGIHSGLLLPQVAREYGWDRNTFLAQTCRKAGLHPTAWQEQGTDIFCFEAEVF
ncbi:MAG TPA: AmmeMemoRadiSam system protein A [Desulfonatronum sp.]|mgnify:CR=1 FL=1|nr:AmmeMemoRadiSam system protein A [Desulfonatronum sp.]